MITKNKFRELFTIALVASFVLGIQNNPVMAGEIPVGSHTGTRVDVNFKQDKAKDELTISVKTSTVAIMQLFIFTPDGILIKEVAVSSHAITTIRGLKKGFYVYECFNNDTRMKSGNLLIK